MTYIGKFQFLHIAGGGYFILFFHVDYPYLYMTISWHSPYSSLPLLANYHLTQSGHAKSRLAGSRISL